MNSSICCILGCNNLLYKNNIPINSVRRKNNSIVMKKKLDLEWSRCTILSLHTIHRNSFSHQRCLMTQLISGDSQRDCGTILCRNYSSPFLDLYLHPALKEEEDICEEKKNLVSYKSFWINLSRIPFLRENIPPKSISIHIILNPIADIYE